MYGIGITYCYQFRTFATTNNNTSKIRQMDSNVPQKIRELMPDGYLPLLVASTGSKNYSNLAQIVRNEHTTSKHWPAVLALAEQTDPVRYALWAATNPEKLPAPAVAA